MKIVLASGNIGKVKEIRDILRDFEVIPYSEIIKPFEIVENGKTFKENAIIKAKAVYDKLNGKYFVLADDSGISVPILKNAPGIYSKRYAGDNASDKDNLNKLIHELKKRGLKRTKAFYTAATALATPYGVFTTHGFMRGEVIDEARGNKGFGYDPMFIPKGFDKTLGELDESIKQKISHRFKALELMKIILTTIKF